MGREKFDAEAWCQDSQAFRSWSEDDARQLREEITQRKTEREEADPLGGLLLFFADGYELGARPLAVRAAVFLLLVRPDLVSDSQGVMAGKLGCSVETVRQAVRLLRELAPGLGPAFASPQTSRARLVTLGHLRRRRRELALADAEALAAARRSQAAERVKTARDTKEARRLRVARQTLALASEIQRAAAADMLAFDVSMGLRPSKPRPATEDGGEATGGN